MDIHLKSDMLGFSGSCDEALAATDLATQLNLEGSAGTDWGGGRAASGTILHSSAGGVEVHRLHLIRSLVELPVCLRRGARRTGPTGPGQLVPEEILELGPRVPYTITRLSHFDRVWPGCTCRCCLFGLLRARAPLGFSRLGRCSHESIR